MMIAFSVAGPLLRLGCAFVLVPRYGIMGSAVTVLVSKSALAVGLWAYLFRAQLKTGSLTQLRVRFREALAALTLSA